MDARYKPAVKKPWLYFLAGSVWIVVGLLLISLAVSWVRIEHLQPAGWLLASGSMAGLLIHHFGFLRVVDKNLARFKEMKGQPCIFSFMSWKSYLLVAIMMGVGFTLRHSGIPHVYLVPVYTAIGLALLLSSMRYFRFLYKIVRTPRR